MSEITKIKRRVRLITGELVNREEAVQLFDGGYIKIADAINANGEYFKKDDPNILYDYFTNAPFHYKHIRSDWYFNNPISLKKEFTTEDPEKYNDIFVNAITENGTKFRSLKSLVENNVNFVDSLSSYYYVHINYLKKNPSYLDKGRYLRFDNTYKFNPENIKVSTEFGTFSPTFRITEGKKYTFGVEIETSLGVLYPHHYHNLNVCAVHDGSLRGPGGEDPIGGEYVTGVLTGDMGFYQLNKLCSVLSKRCEIDKRCGVHVHIGIDPSKTFIVSLYKLLLDIEEEMFSLLPQSRRTNTYCRKLCRDFDFNNLKNTTGVQYEFEINKLFSEIYRYVNVKPVKMIGNFGIFSKENTHPLGDKCGFRHETPRYCWVNFVPALLSEAPIKKI